MTPGPTSRRQYLMAASRKAGVSRKDRSTAAQYIDLANRHDRIREAVALVMLSDLAQWNLRLTETLTPHPNYLARKVKHELRIPSAIDLTRAVIAGRELPTSTEKIRLLIPVAFRSKGKLLSGFSVSSSHAPVTVLNMNEGEEFTRKILSRLIPHDTVPYFKNISWQLARVLKNRYIQFVEVEARLGDVVKVEYTIKFRHLEASADGIAPWRLAMGWRQNRFRFKSELHNTATSYHFHFEVPDGFILKEMRLVPEDGRVPPRHEFSGAGTPDGHIYIPRGRESARSEPLTNFIFIDCFEAPPGSQGYTAVIGCVTTVMIFFLMAALSHGWLLDGESKKIQATGAIALIAGSPAVVASLLPLRHDPALAIRPPLTARLALWASTAMSAFIALALATQGFGDDLSKLAEVNIGKCFLDGLVTMVGAAALLVMARRWFQKSVYCGLLPLLGIVLIISLVINQAASVTPADIFFSAFVPAYILIWMRCASGWVKSVYLSSGIGRTHLR